ncbi:hypothetical protein [Natrialba asiatica]|uniref:DUF2231 domain-containing protein n=1 Tax=Natrialba asiatica (strain ATCC 700177 / DSM 12278 / JCM 9576 / FERM P-10747 / NBRC 102637 / 172P1) TaxID=29540 RepID=M0AKR7_NATA1|nr:hypothetical protein [Natrialba asiatica]ELY97968.1 hypothetical protein C481_18570 [Natrialba asiatica DSM 12278]
MGKWLPATYNLVLFLVSALLYPVLGLLIGEPFTEPTIVELTVVPAVIVLGGNVAYAIRAERGDSGVVDERDLRNIHTALAGAGIVLLGSLVAVYVGYATATRTAPAAVNYLAVAGVATIFAILGGTELQQRL